MNDCVFCQIAAGKLPSQKVYEDEDVLAFYDVRPVAPVHVLVVPRVHRSSILEATPEELGRLFDRARQLARGLDQGRGFRLVVNTGDNGGQTVPHLHVHVLAGRAMTWPPG